MFEDSDIPLRVANIAHRTLEKDDHEHQLVELTLELTPLSPERAQQLSAFMRATLFTRSDATANTQLQRATFDVVSKPQAIDVRMAPDQGEPSFSIDEAKIGNLHAKRSKKTSAWTLTFTATFAPANEHQLAQVVDTYLKTPYLTFEDAHPDLFSDLGKERSKARRAAASVSAAVN